MLENDFRTVVVQDICGRVDETEGSFVVERSRWSWCGNGRSCLKVVEKVRIGFYNR